MKDGLSVRSYVFVTVFLPLDYFTYRLHLCPVKIVNYVASYFP